MNLLESSPDVAAIVIISTLLLFFAFIVAFMIHIVSTNNRQIDYEKVADNPWSTVDLC